MTPEYVLIGIMVGLALLVIICLLLEKEKAYAEERCYNALGARPEKIKSKLTKARPEYTDWDSAVNKLTFFKILTGLTALNITLTLLIIS